MNNPLDIENLKEIGVTLARNKTRTILTAFGIFWGTTMLALLWGGAEGMQGMLMRHVAGFSTNSGVLFPNLTTMSYKGFNKGMRWDLTDRDVDLIRHTTPYIEHLASVISRGATLKYGTKSVASIMIGVTEEYASIQTPIIFEGRFINEHDVKTSRKVGVIGKNLAGTLFGDKSPIGQYVEVNGVYIQIVGMAGQLSDGNIGGRIDDSIIVPLPVSRAGYSDQNTVGFVMFTAMPGHTPTELRPYFDRAIRKHHPIHPDDKNYVWFLDISEQFRQVSMMFLGVSLLALFVGGGTLIAGVIGVGNIMWIVVKERSQEIGIRRAIGATPRNIILQILSESVFLTLVAGTAGIAFSVMILAAADHLTFDPLYGSAHFQIPLHNALIIMITFVVFGALAGLIPALKAMRIKPVEAINAK